MHRFFTLILLPPFIGILLIIIVVFFGRRKQKAEASKAAERRNVQRRVEERNSTRIHAVQGRNPPSAASLPSCQPQLPRSPQMTITSHLNDAPSQPRWSAPATRESIVPTVSREQDRPLSTFPNSATSTHDVSEIIASSNLTSQPSPPGAVHPRRRSAPPPPPTRRSNTHTIPQERSLPSPRNSGTSTQNISEGAASTSNPANQSSSLRLSAHQLSFVRSLTDRGVSGIALTSIVESMLAQNDGTIPTIPLVQQGSTNQNGADRIERVASPPPSYQPFDI